MSANYNLAFFLFEQRFDFFLRMLENFKSSWKKKNYLNVESSLVAVFFFLNFIYMIINF